jgi:hypothetical protein
LRGLDGLGDGAVCRHDDNHQRGPTTLQFLKESKPIHIVQVQVNDDQVGTGTNAGIERSLRRLDDFHRVVGRAQPGLHEATRFGVIVDYHDPRPAFNLWGCLITRLVSLEFLSDSEP